MLSASLASCGSIKSANPAFIAPAVIAECADLPLLPEKEMTMAEVEQAWGKDRYLYVVCQSSKAELIQILKDRGLVNDS